MNIALLGGSFNPPHICHLFISCYVLSRGHIDQLWIIPCYKHAFGKQLVAFQHRLTMCRLAVESLREGRIHVSAIEQERQGTSWTIDTVRYLRAKHPEHTFTWVIGSDVLHELEHWKEAEALSQLIAFLVVPRSGFENALSQPSPHHAGQAHTSDCRSGKIGLLRFTMDAIETSEFQLPNISSSLIRERLLAQKSITHLVPQNVAEYIQAHNLYTSPHA